MQNDLRKVATPLVKPGSRGRRATAGGRWAVRKAVLPRIDANSLEFEPDSLERRAVVSIISWVRSVGACGGEPESPVSAQIGPSGESVRYGEALRGAWAWSAIRRVSARVNWRSK